MSFGANVSSLALVDIFVPEFFEHPGNRLKYSWSRIEPATKFRRTLRARARARARLPLRSEGALNVGWFGQTSIFTRQPERPEFVSRCKPHFVAVALLLGFRTMHFGATRCTNEKSWIPLLSRGKRWISSFLLSEGGGTRTHDQRIKRILR